jgi:hypothetical protein
VTYRSPLDSKLSNTHRGIAENAYRGSLIYICTNFKGGGDLRVGGPGEPGSNSKAGRLSKGRRCPNLKGELWYLGK